MTECQAGGWHRSHVICHRFPLYSGMKGKSNGKVPEWWCSHSQPIKIIRFGIPRPVGCHASWMGHSGSAFECVEKIQRYLCRAKITFFIRADVFLGRMGWAWWWPRWKWLYLYWTNEEEWKAINLFSFGLDCVWIGKRTVLPVGNCFDPALNGIFES